MLEICETAIFLRDLRGEKFSVYLLRYTSYVDTPPAAAHAVIERRLCRC